MGSVGSGKSSLFAALQAEIIKQKGAVAVCDLEKGEYYLLRKLCSSNFIGVN